MCTNFLDILKDPMIDTLKHFLKGCRDLALMRQSFFNAKNMKDLFENVDMDDIFSFLREIKLYQKL